MESEARSVSLGVCPKWTSCCMCYHELSATEWSPRHSPTEDFCYMCEVIVSADKLYIITATNEMCE